MKSKWKTKIEYFHFTWILNRYRYRYRNRTERKWNWTVDAYCWMLEMVWCLRWWLWKYHCRLCGFWRIAVDRKVYVRKKPKKKKIPWTTQNTSASGNRLQLCHWSSGCGNCYFKMKFLNEMDSIRTPFNSHKYNRFLVLEVYCFLFPFSSSVLTLTVAFV